MGVDVCVAGRKNLSQIAGNKVGCETDGSQKQSVSLTSRYAYDMLLCKTSLAPLSWEETHALCLPPEPIPFDSSLTLPQMLLWKARCGREAPQYYYSTYYKTYPGWLPTPWGWDRTSRSGPLPWKVQILKPAVGGFIISSSSFPWNLGIVGP